MKIILDTDFILISLKYKVHILTELNRICSFKYKVYILDKTIQELENKPLEKLAKKFIKNIGVIKTKSSKTVDELLLKQKNAVIATQDKLLKEKLKNKKIPIITIRQKKYLILQNVL